MNGVADAAITNSFHDVANTNATTITTRLAEVGLAGATITVYGDNELILGTTTSAASGSWSLVIPNSYTGTQVLVECTPPASLAFLQPGPYGTDNGTTVVKAAKTATNVNFTFGLGSEHAQNSPDLALACFALPNPSNTTGNPGSTEPMVIRFPYINGGPLTSGTRNAATGTGQNYYSATKYPPATTGKSVVTTFGETGTVYGVAYDKRRSRLLTSAFERAYTGIGPTGTGGTGKLYTTTLSASTTATTTSLWLDLETALSTGVTGTDPAITAGLSFVSSAPKTISRFEHNKIGHISLGDLEFSADGKTVFVVNLFSKQIYGIPVNADGTPNTAGIKTYTPTNPCASGSFSDPATPAGARPYNALLGLGVHPETGRIYCAVTCTGPTSVTTLRGYIYSFDPTAAVTTFTEELQIPLNFNFQTGNDGTEGSYATTGNDVWAPTANNADITDTYSDHAWLGDIIFDINPDGTIFMVVGGRNRFMDATSGSRITHGQGLWLSAPSGSNWTLEQNGVAGSRTTANTLTEAWFTARSGNGVFFNTHGSEGTNGTGNIIALPGFTELALGAVDNVKSGGNSGVMFMNRTNGTRTRDILLLGGLLEPGGTAPRGEVYKANLWGEVEALLEPAPLEVGNYVFMDLNKNGLQDPSDLPIAGITVKLVEDTNGDGLPNETAVASTTTNASGQYYFNRAAGLKYDTKYVLVINQATDFTTGALSGLLATTANVGANAKDTRDSDGELLGTNQYVKVAFETGGPGENRHSYDFGFVAADCGLNMVVTPSLCLSATNSYVLSGTITATNVPTSGTLTISSTAFTPRSLTLPAGNASGTFSYSGLVSNGQAYTVTASYSNSACSPVSQTYSAPASCSVAPPCSISAVATAGLCATATNTYSASVAISLTNSPAGTITVSIPGSSPISQTLAANTSSFTAVFAGLTSDGVSHTATISLPGCGTTTAIFTAPVSCSVAPVCSLTATATPGTCQSATNTFTTIAVITVKNPTTGILTVTDGPASLTFATTAGSSASFTATLANIVSNGASHTITASLPGCSTTTTTYTAPVSCSVAPACSLTATATAGLCVTATNTYSSTAVVRLSNPTAGTLTITDGPQSATFITTAGSSATFTVAFTNLVSNGSTHTVTASLPGCSTTTTTYSAPVSCSATPACSLSAVVTHGLCTTATNTYSVTAVVTVTNPAAGGSLTVSTGGQTLTFSTTALSQNTFTATFNGLISDGASHIVAVSLPGCGSANTTYTAPASCSVAPVCSLSAVATPGICATTTNTFSNTVLVTLTNPTAGTLTVTDGTRSVTFVVPASLGTTTAPAIFNGIPSDGTIHTVVVSLPGCSSTTITYTAPSSCTVSALASLGDYVWYDTNGNGQQDSGETGVVGVTVKLFNPTSSTTTPIASLTTDSNGKYLFTNLNPGIYCVLFDKTTLPTGFTLTSANTGADATDSDANTVTGKTDNYTLAAGQQNLTVDAGVVPPATTLSLDKFVSKSTAKLGDVLTYTIVMTNSGLTNAVNVVVQDSSTSGLRYVTGSSTAPTGTTFTQGTPISTWKAATLSAGQSLSMTFQAVVDSSGILYNKATLPGDTATVCTSVPVIVCTGDIYTFQLTAAPGRSSYKWFKDNVEITGQTTNVLNVTAPGTYSLAVDNVTGKCPDFSCCPFIVEEDTLPTFQVTATPVTCVSNQAQVNGKITLSGFNPTYSYQYSLGTSFNEAAPLSGSAKVIPAGGVIVSNLANPTVAQSYTIRVYNASGCYTEMTVMLLPTTCGCPADVCVPLVIRQSKRVKRIGDAR